MRSEFAKKFFAGFSFLFVFSLFAVAGLGQANNSISGFVFGLERKPLSNVSVELQDDLYRLVARTETNGAGRFNFTRLSRGRYNVRVTPTGTNYQEQTKDIEIANVSVSGSGGAETVQQNFYLQIKQDSTAVSTLKKGVVFAQEIPKEAQKIYEKAVSDLDDKKFEDGLAELKQALEIFPDYYLALEKLANEYIKKEDYKNAFEIANKGVKVNNNSYECWYVAGYSAFKLKNSDEAVKALSKAVLILPNSINALFVLGVNLKQIGKYEEAETNLLKAKKFATNPVPEIHWNLALLYTNNLKKYDAAIKELELFLQAKPNFEETDKVKDLIKKLKEKAKNNN